MAQAYNYVHNEVVFHPNQGVDGTKSNGSFQQHGGIIYNANYGKD